MIFWFQVHIFFKTIFLRKYLLYSAYHQCSEISWRCTFKLIFFIYFVEIHFVNSYYLILKKYIEIILDDILLSASAPYIFSFQTNLLGILFSELTFQSPDLSVPTFSFYYDFSVCFAWAVIDVACTLSSESCTTNIVPGELHSASSCTALDWASVIFSASVRKLCLRYQENLRELTRVLSPM